MGSKRICIIVLTYSQYVLAPLRILKNFLRRFKNGKLFSFLSDEMYFALASHYFNQALKKKNLYRRNKILVYSRRI